VGWILHVEYERMAPMAGEVHELSDRSPLRCLRSSRMEEAVRLRNVDDRILRDFHGILSKAIPLRQQSIRLGWKTHRECWRNVTGQFLKAALACRLAAPAMTMDQDDGGMTNK
jgi:hypothetical protein